MRIDYCRYGISVQYTGFPRSCNNRAAAWIGYCRLLSDIIGYFPHSFKIHELPGGKSVYGNNGTFYGGTKI